MTRLRIDNSLADSVAALRKDLLAPDGPRISTMRNYRFTILPYAPTMEFELRGHIKALSDELIAQGWRVLSISLNQLLLDRLKAQGEETLQRMIAREVRLHQRNPDRALNSLQQQISPHLEGMEGIAADIVARIETFAREAPDHQDKTVIWLGRVGGLYPFLRSSALLKHLDGKTQNLPVVLLYPGERRDVTALSFMGEMTADRDYRPRIY